MRTVELCSNPSYATFSRWVTNPTILLIAAAIGGTAYYALHPNPSLDSEIEEL